MKTVTILSSDPRYLARNSPAVGFADATVIEFLLQASRDLPQDLAAALLFPFVCFFGP